jgi:hypothetical protein
MPELDCSEFVFQLTGKAFGREVGGARAHHHRTPGLARPGTFAKLAACHSIRKLPISPE